MTKTPSLPAWASLATEALHPGSARLDLLSPEQLLDFMAREDARAVRAVRGERGRIVKAARLMARALSSGARVFYVGAGTSGRLGVLEAAECPPTFGTSPDQIVALMAGGPQAVFLSKEGAEDSARDGARALRAHRPKAADLVVGISASSVTAFVQGAFELAQARGCSTILVTCGRRPRGQAELVIAPQVGAEVLAGSTRMKAATATKLVLNQMTLAAMIQLHKVFGPFMVDVRPTSAKLRDRAARMVSALARVSKKRATHLLKAASYEAKTAVVMGRLKLGVSEARRLLEDNDGDLRSVIAS